MTNYYPISPARRRAKVARLGQSLTSPWVVRLARVLCIAALGVVVLSAAEPGHGRQLVGWLVILGFAPASLALDLLVSAEHRFRLHTLFDLLALVCCSLLLPQIWHPALMIGAVVLGMGVPAYSVRGWGSYLALLLSFGLAMGWIADRHAIADSYLPLVAIFASIPIVLVYALIERRRAQALADRSELFEGLSQLAGRVGQDFNNMLMTIQGNVELLGLHLEDGHPARQHLSELHAASQKAALLSAQLLAFSGNVPSGREQLNIREEILALLGMLRGLVPSVIELRADIAPDLPMVDADRAQLQQIIFNIVMYAANQFDPGKASIDVKVRRARFRAGEQLLIQVPVARGCTLAELFSEQRSNGGQRGIGINRVLRFIDGHDGAIELYPARQSALSPQPTAGAVVTLRLPVLADTVAPAPTNAIPRTVPPQRIRLLGEESSVLTVTRALLEAQGHLVSNSNDCLLYTSDAADE